MHTVNWNIYSQIPAASAKLQHALAHTYSINTLIHAHNVHALSATVTHRQCMAIHSWPAQKQSNGLCQLFPGH